MKYEEMKKKVFVNAIIPDGFNGHRCKIGIALINNRLVAVWESGTFPLSGHSYLDEEEALFRIKGQWGDLKHVQLCE